ncbi:MAG: alpha-hydroxy-acid oxidizing protein [Sulfuritalea sp.]|nr:alpha-hydroxy-acid oxidizing protein [Sulfuritalea sp.]
MSPKAPEVLMDRGVRSGLDVVKALALGAKACMLGRAWDYAEAVRFRPNYIRAPTSGNAATPHQACAPRGHRPAECSQSELARQR